jgi:signal transduction histidine kinase
VGQFLERKRAEEEADRVKDEFFSLVSHEFRTPLTSIVGYVELLMEQNRGFELPAEQQANFLLVIKRNSERLHRLVDDLLFVSKVQSGRFALEPREIRLEEVVGHSIEAARPAAEQNGIDLSFDAGSLPSFYGDPDRLAQLFDNLISNAVKYTPRGERVAVRLQNGSGTVIAEVTNSGVHIPPDELGRLFEPFFRSSTATQAPGVGLGLTIAKSIASAHGGQIRVESDETSGTTFRVELPLRATEAGVEARGALAV